MLKFFSISDPNYNEVNNSGKIYENRMRSPRLRIISAFCSLTFSDLACSILIISILSYFVCFWSGDTARPSNYEDIGAAYICFYIFCHATISYLLRHKWRSGSLRNSQHDSLNCKGWNLYNDYFSALSAFVYSFRVLVFYPILSSRKWKKHLQSFLLLVCLIKPW